MSQAAIVLKSHPPAPALDIVYGPVDSRRLGRSLGINPLGENKICSFDCGYCSLGATSIRMNQIKKDISFPSVDEIENRLREKLRQLIAMQSLPQTLTVSGNGEPTLHPMFSELTERLITARNEMCPQVPLVILTNGAHIDNRRIIQSLDMYNDRMIKIDAGSDNEFRRVNNPLVRANISKIISGARKLKDCVVQSMFVQGSLDNTSPAAIDDWMEVIGIIRPKEVHIYSMNEIPADSGILAASEDTLYTIASKLKRRIQLEARVFP